MTRAILAIESSCDETAVAVVAEDGTILAEGVESQIETHRLYGGVVPEIASRSHFAALDGLVKLVWNEAKARKPELTAVAATCGPGLIGPLLVGASYAEGLARAAGLPFRGVHHLRGHLASVLLSIEGGTLSEKTNKVFPALVLLVSGGHTQILEVDAQLRARRWADTADDAAGECFDKSAKLMGLPYPGGPEIERLAMKAELTEAKRLMQDLPRPKSSEGFSFSGLKTAIRLRLEKDPTLSRKPEFAWAIQETVSETLRAGLDRTVQAARLDLKSFVLCGGVAANKRIRESLGQWAARHKLQAHFPPLKHATDNAAMIAAAAWVQDPALELHEVVARTPVGLEE